MAQLNFDASQVAPAQPMEAIPAGWYVAMMTASEMKPTSAGNGAYLETENTILEGEYKGRKLFDRLNLQNPNQTAMEIAYKQLSAICHAIGVIQVQDSSQLHNRPFQIKVSLKPAGPGADGKHYEASNEVKGYKAVEGAVPQQPQQYAPPPPAAVANPQYTQQQQFPQQQAPQAAPWAPPPAAAQPVAPATIPTPGPAYSGAPAPVMGAPVSGQPPWANQIPQQPAQAAAPAPAAPQPQQAAAPVPPWQQPGAPTQAAPTPPWVKQ